MSPFHLLLKPAGAACNLRCRYCFYLGKSALYPDSSLRMSDRVLAAALAQLLAAHPGPEVTVAWQGGEPTLMGLEFYRRAAALIDRFRRPGQRVVQTLQTNGVLLDEEWAAFLAEHHVLVGLSMDGPAPLHDTWRVDRGGHPTWARVRRAWELLAGAGAEVNILCAVHAANALRPLEVYRCFRDQLGARFLQFIPIVEPSSSPAGGRVPRVSARSVRPGQYGRFLSVVFDEWAARDVGQVFVQGFDAALASWLGQPSLCTFEKRCGRALVLEHNGDVYACDHFVDAAHRLGNILEQPLAELVDSPLQQAFGAAKEAALPAACHACDVLFACRGECPRNRFATADGASANYLCADYRHFFHHVAPALDVMAGLARRGRPAAGAMPGAAAAAAELRQRVRDAGRNDPCPCGSTLKLKHCHGARPAG